MANTPKKVKDPTEVALSAIQEALNIDGSASDTEGSAQVDGAPEVAPSPSFDEAFDGRPGGDRPSFNAVEEPLAARRPANDDREAIGQALQAIQRGRLARNTYTLAIIFAAVWILGAIILTVSFLPSLQAAIGQGAGGMLALAGLVALFAAPVLLFFFMASLSWRSSELQMIAQSMAQVAIRLSDPETAASDSMVTVGQAIRREVAAMGDGVERAIARAGELESLVANEVSALERAYSDNEVRIRALLQDIAHQRDNLVGQAEQVRSAISGVQIDLRHDIALISDAIASRVDEVAKSITGALEERGAHITSALSNAGDNMILALGERGGDLLDRLEEASAETTRAVLDASERLTTSLNFKTGHVHDEFVELADRVQDLLNERLDRVTAEFEQRSAAIVDGISDRTEQVHDSLKNSSDSLLLELELRSGDLINKIDESGSQLASKIVTSGEKASDALDASVNSLVAKVISQTETAHDSLSLQLGAFDELVKNQGSELAEKFARDSGTLGALITRHISEFDRTVKTFGGEIVERMGQRTGEIADTLKNYVDNFDTRLTSNGGEITASLDQRLLQFETTLGTRVTHLDTSLDSKIKSFDESIEGRLKSLEHTFDTRAQSVTETIDGRLGTLTAVLTDGAAQSIAAIDQRIANATETIDGRAAHLIETIDGRSQHLTDAIDGRSNQLTETITARFQEIHQGIESRIGAVATDIGSRVSQFEELLGTRVEAVAGRIESTGREASEGLVTRAEQLAAGIKSHVEDAERALSNLVLNTSETIQTGTRAAQESLLGVSSEVERALNAVGSSTANSIVTSAREAQTTLVAASADAANQVKLLTADMEQSLSAAGSATASSILANAREVQSVLVGASSEAATQVKSLATDIERTLMAVGSDTAASILNSAREAQTSLAATSADAASQIRAISSDLERSLSVVTTNTTDRIAATAQTAQQAMIAASNEASAKVKSTSADIERTVVAAGSSFGAAMSGKTDEIVSYVRQQTDRLSQAIDGKRGVLVEAIDTKSGELTAEIERVTAEAMRSIESRAQGFSQALAGNSTEVVRNITSAGDLATSTINKSLKDLELASRNAIDQSRQVSIAAVTEMQETSKILRTDTVALFERLREGNILLQEVLTGAHDNLNSLERALVTRVADFVTAMNDVTSRNGTATQTLEDQLKVFNSKTTKALQDLNALSGQFEAHGKTLVEAAAVVEHSNRSTSSSLAERKSTLESLVTTIDLRTTDLDQRLSRFTGLLDESLAAAEERARDIARVVAETAGAGSAMISRQFEAVRAAAEEERRQTADTMAEIYQQSTEEADAMFKQSAERFGNMVASMKQMASEMQRELEATRNELRRGVLEMPQEAADSTAQMRKVIVDQIEALAELNRIVAHHGRGLDVSTARATSYREEEPAMTAAVGGRTEPRPAPRANSASSLPPPDLGMPASARRTEAPPVAPAGSDQGRDGWLSDLLSRTDGSAGAPPPAAPRGNRPAPQGGTGGNPLESLSLDIGRLMDRNLAAEMWDRYQRGEGKAFSKRLYTPAGQKAFDEVARKYRSDRNFKQTVDRYIAEFERLLDEVAREDRGPQALRAHLTSETGLVYTLLAHAAGRLG